MVPRNSRKSSSPASVTQTKADSNTLALRTLQGEAKALIAAFKPFFESPDVKKVWHNYSFDRHVLGNMGVHCQGFAGDTMHMARLWDSSRRGTKSYSLASLTGYGSPSSTRTCVRKRRQLSHRSAAFRDERCPAASSPTRVCAGCRDDNLMRGFQGDDARGKLSMKEIFGKRNITKSGLEGKVCCRLAIPTAICTFSLQLKVDAKDPPVARINELPDTC